MAVKATCDRCGSELMDQDCQRVTLVRGVNPFSRHVRGVADPEITMSDLDMDVCDQCADSLVRIWAPMNGAVEQA